MIFFVSIIIFVLWVASSTWRLILVKRRVHQDWAGVSFFLQERGRLAFQQEGDKTQEILQAHGEVMKSLKEVEKEGGPLKTSLLNLEKAEQGLQSLLEESPSLSVAVAQTKEKLSFATQTYNDGVRLLYRLKYFPFHFPIALMIYPKRVDFFEAEPSAAKRASKLEFKI